MRASPCLPTTRYEYLWYRRAQCPNGKSSPPRTPLHSKSEPAIGHAGCAPLTIDMADTRDAEIWQALSGRQHLSLCPTIPRPGQGWPLTWSRSPPEGPLPRSPHVSGSGLEPVQPPWEPQRRPQCPKASYLLAVVGYHPGRLRSPVWVTDKSATFPRRKTLVCFPRWV